MTDAEVEAWFTDERYAEISRFNGGWIAEVWDNTVTEGRARGATPLKALAAAIMNYRQHVCGAV